MIVNLWMMIGQTLHKTQTTKLPSTTQLCETEFNITTVFTSNQYSDNYSTIANLQETG